MTNGSILMTIGHSLPSKK